MSKQAVSKHIQVLEQADLVTRSRDAQRRPVHLNPTALEELTAWIDHYRLVHERRFRSLDALLDRHTRRLTRTDPTRTTMNQERAPAMSTSRTTNALTVTAPEGLPFIDFEREFDHPVEKVFRAHRDPDLFRQWIGAGRDDVELRPVQLHHRRPLPVRPEGRGRRRVWFNGVYHVVRENEFAIQTFEFEGYPDVVSIESLTFERLDGSRTRLRGHAVYPTMEARDGMVGSGMEAGLSAGYDKLDTVLEEAGVSGTERPMDWTLEVVVLPVSDLERAIAFYRDQVGFDLDHHTTNEFMDVAQLTPRGSGCSIVIGNLPSQKEMAPGSMRGLQLCVADATAARDQLVARRRRVQRDPGLRRAGRWHLLRVRRPGRQHLGRAAAQGPRRHTRSSRTRRGVASAMTCRSVAPVCRNARGA